MRRGTVVSQPHQKETEMTTNNWTIERIRRLTTEEIKALEGNANTRGSLDVAKLCEAVRLERMTGSERKKALGITTFEAKIANVLSAAAVDLSKKYDLSVETAKAHGTTRPHKLLGANDWAKTGGDMLNGDVEMNIYISYRLKDTRITAAVMVLREETIDKAKYILKGSPDALPDGKPLSGLVEAGRVGVLFSNVEELAAAYGVALARFAPQRKM